MPDKPNYVVHLPIFISNAILSYFFGRYCVFRGGSKEQEVGICLQDPHMLCKLGAGSTPGVLRSSDLQELAGKKLLPAGSVAPPLPFNHCQFFFLDANRCCRKEKTVSSSFAGEGEKGTRLHVTASFHLPSTSTNFSYLEEERRGQKLPVVVNA